MRILRSMRSLLLVLALVLTVFPFVNSCAPANKYDYDVLIKGGQIYDGTTNPPFTGDIGIKGDKIVAIGKLSGRPNEVIDAKGCIVTPGFIDCHNHTDLAYQVLANLTFIAPFLPEWKGNYNHTFQGVTTIITGNCGVGATDTAAWLDKINSLGGFGTNVYHLIPYEAVKSEVIGIDQRYATAQELEAVQKKIAAEMEKGAVGLSTGVYAYDTTDEIVEAAKVVNKYGGIYDTNIRSEYGESLDNGKIAVIEALKEAIDIGRKTGIPVQIAHIKIGHIQNSVMKDPQQMIDMIVAAQQEGIDVTADQYPYETECDPLLVTLNYKYLTGGQLKKEFKTSQGKMELKKGADEALSLVPPEDILIVGCDVKKDYEGKNIKQIAELEKREPADVYMDCVLMDKPPYCAYFTQDINIVRSFMKYDWVFTGSDGALFPKSFAPIVGKMHPRFYGTFSRKLKQFVLDEKLMDLQSAIRSMSSMPAEKFKLKGRGKIAEGYYADIAVIDLSKLADKATYEDPIEYPTGVVDLIVNGVIEIRDGNATGQAGGRGCTKE